MNGVSELRHKESDRIKVVKEGLSSNGVKIEDSQDQFKVVGKGSAGVIGGGIVEAYHDHRIAMSFCCLGSASKKGITIKGANTINTSFPTFGRIMTSLGCNLNAKA